MSTVTNPGPWYSSLVNYKHGSTNDYNLVSALIAAYLRAHEHQIRDLLGGDFSRIAVVPSTRGRPFNEHPLARAVGRSEAFRSRLTDALSHVASATIARQEYKPAIYAANAGAVEGQRVVLIEDLWVSGAKAVSAAGALLASGATSVAILPVAREIRPSTPSFCPEEYVRKTNESYNVDFWPR
jgi:predicted amidophosphoribosyltransferase